MMDLAIKVYKCKICGVERLEVDPDGTQLCNNCWEIDHRLGDITEQAAEYFHTKLVGILLENTGKWLNKAAFDVYPELLKKNEIPLAERSKNYLSAEGSVPGSLIPAIQFGGTALEQLGKKGGDK